MFTGEQEINGVFVYISPPSWQIVDAEAKAQCPFWLGINVAEGLQSDVERQVNQVIQDNPSLGVKVEFAIDYTDPANFIGKGLQHPGLFFTWNWNVPDKQISELSEENRWKLLEERAFDCIGRFITLLQSRRIRVSQQHPYSPKNIWLNHFRPTIELLMTLGRNFWLPALSMSILCIDAAYQDSKGCRQDPPYTHEMLHWTFHPYKAGANKEELHNMIKLLSKNLANGLKHDTLVRDPIILENPKFENMLSEGKFTVFLDAERTTPIFAVRNDLRNVERIVVSPKSWWLAVRNRIDQHYDLL